MDYLKFENWKNSHSTDMQDLTFSYMDDIFIFTRFTQNLPFKTESKQVLFAGDINEVIGFIRHIFLYDILNDVTDDLEFDFKKQFNEKQNDAIAIFNYWYKLGKISPENTKNELDKFLNEFNSRFNHRNTTEYEIIVINGADDLRKFLNKRFKDDEKFNKQKLSNICSSDLFAGKILEDFLDDLFYLKKQILKGRHFVRKCLPLAFVISQID